MTGLFGELIKIYGAPFASLLIVILGFVWFSRALAGHVGDLKISLGGIVKDIEHLVEKVNDVEATAFACRESRRKTESEIQGRVTSVAERTSRIEGRINGQGGFPHDR